MATWEDLLSELRTVIGALPTTENPAPKFTDELLQLAFNRAQDHFAIRHTAKVKRVTFTATVDGDGGYVTRPADLIQLSMIADTANAVYYKPVRPGWEEEDPGFFEEADRFYFPSSAPSGVLSYYALWPKMVTTASVSEFPQWAEWSIMNLAIAFALSPNMVSHAGLSRFKSNRDAGDPIDNPQRNQAQYHLALYEAEVNSVRPQDRATYGG